MAKKPFFKNKKTPTAPRTADNWINQPDMSVEIDPDMVYDPPNPGKPGRHDWNEDPFMDYLKHDGAVDPSIAHSRSEELVQHKGAFWVRPGETVKVQPIKEEVSDAEDTSAEINQKDLPIWERDVFRKLIALSAIVLGVLLLLFLIFQMVFRINPEKIRVEGNHMVSSQDIIRLSGITGQDNIWLLDDQPVKEKIESNTMLMFVCIDKHLPDGVTIRVKERNPASYISYCGVLYTLDSRGIVLKSSDDAANPPELLKVEGFDIRNCSTGRRLSVQNTKQIEIYMEMVREIKAIGLTNLIAQMYIADDDNINLMTAEGSYIRMGNSEKIHVKLEAMKVVYNYVTEQNYGTGTIDVSNPERPSFIPEQAQS